ncbi:MAG: hypothetical protein M3153_07210 [Chloroflexota bacterium]|nr:hypothetical protein [Chloroflexota bacterium]
MRRAHHAIANGVILRRSMSVTQLHPDRSRALREAFRRAESIGPFRPAGCGLAAALVVSYVADGLLAGLLGTPLRQLVDAAVFVGVMTPVWLLLQPSSVRRAHDVMTWLNGWETERWQGELGRRLPALPRATPAIVNSMPDTLGLRPLRVELLVANGRLEEAHERLAQLPTDTAWQRFERAALAEWAAWWADEPGDRSAMRAAAADIEDDERRLAARVMIAAAEARRAATAGGDAIGPLSALRDELGDRPRRYAFGYTAGVLGMVGLMGLVASATITVTSAVIR